MLVIGITGTLGAGKGTLVDYLVHEKGYQHFSVRQFLIQEIEQRKLIVNRDSMTKVANELRQKHHPAYIIEKLYEKASMQGNRAIIESIRTPGEVAFLRNEGNFFLLAVDANPKVRYARIQTRASETDQVDYDTFLSNETREMTTTDPNKQNLSKCIQLADFRLNNDGTKEQLLKQMETVLNQISSEETTKAK